MHTLTQITPKTRWHATQDQFTKLYLIWPDNKHRAHRLRIKALWSYRCLFIFMMFFAAACQTWLLQLWRNFEVKFLKKRDANAEARGRADRALPDHFLIKQTTQIMWSVTVSFHLTAILCVGVVGCLAFVKCINITIMYSFWNSDSASLWLTRTRYHELTTNITVCLPVSPPFLWSSLILSVSSHCILSKQKSCPTDFICLYIFWK